MQIKHEYDQNVHVHFDQHVLDYMKIFSSKAKGTFSTPKNDRQLVI